MWKTCEPQGLKFPLMHASSPQSLQSIWTLRSRQEHQPIFSLPASLPCVWAAEASHRAQRKIEDYTHRVELGADSHSPAILPRGFLDRDRGAGKEDDDAMVLGSKLTP